jgi:hypothetical protein
MKPSMIIRLCTLALALIALATLGAHRAKGHQAPGDGLRTPGDGVRYINSTDAIRGKYQ